MGRRMLGLGAVVALVLVGLGGIRIASLWSTGRIGVYGDVDRGRSGSAAGLHVPYRMYVPDGPGPLRIWVRPNNSGVLDDAVDPHHEAASRYLATARWQADLQTDQSTGIANYQKAIMFPVLEDTDNKLNGLIAPEQELFDYLYGPTPATPAPPP
jgi:hypothetical protein